jgi:hypothetical protein
MTTKESLQRWEKVSQQWMATLDNYSEEELLRQPEEGAWSIGQVYVHLLGSAQFFHLAHVKTCLASNDNSDKSKKMPGKISYFLGSFPPIKIKVPPSPQYTPPQPKSREALRESYANLQKAMIETATAIENTTFKGKSEHPAFGFVSAPEWFLMIEMHFRHHLRQKARLDKFLGK